MKTTNVLWTCALIMLCASLSQAAPIVVTQAAEGEQHTVFVESDGSLWGLGENFQGQLGLGVAVSYTNAPQLVETTNVTAVAAGDEFTIFLESDGSLWGMGLNASGQLGLPSNQSTLLPQKIVANGVKTISARGAHSLFIKTDGSLWAMGDDASGDLGDGTNVARFSPEMIVPSGVTAIAAGANHSLFVKSDGSLWAMGANAIGQLGNGTTTPSLVPEMIVSSGVSGVAAGEQFSLFVKTDGSAWAMGWDLVGQLGDGGSSTNASYTAEKILSANVTAIAAGDAHSLFIIGDGTMWATGLDQSGQLGDGNSSFSIYNRYTPEEIESSNITAIAAGGSTTLFIQADGSLWGAGNNAFGQLGLAVGTSSISSRPKEIVPDLPFSATPTNGQVPLAVSFTSASTDTFGATVVSWTWNFGDGGTANSQNPTHIYTSPGIYTPTLSAFDSEGHTVVGAGPSSIVAEPTNLLYSASPTNGLAPLTVRFSTSSTDANGNSIIAWNWNFGDGTTSAAQSPSHTYSAVGNYSPSLTATNNVGDTLIGTGPTKITVIPSPTLTYTAVPSSGSVPLSVNFSTPNADSFGNTITSWSWDFGDGVGTSSEQSPTYVYTDAGSYTPVLTVRNNIGEQFRATGPSIDVSEPAVEFTASPICGWAPLPVQFTSPNADSAGYSIIDWNWDFGDNIGSSTDQSPSYLYGNPGTYVVALNVDDIYGYNIDATGPSITVGPFCSGLVTNGGFETGDFTGWTLTSPSGNYSTEVDNSFGLTGNYGADFFEEGSLDYIDQTLPTIPGSTYLLSFWLNSPDGQTPNEFEASWNGSTLVDLVNLPAIGWTNLQFVVKATGPATDLQFGGQDDPSDLGLDDVSVISAQPNINHLHVSGSTLVLHGCDGIAGQTYYVLTSTNAATPLDKWATVSTNVLATGGNFAISVTNAFTTTNTQQYFVLVLK